MRAINLALSTACSANCIFCPSNRGAKVSVRYMNPTVVERVVNEVARDPRLRGVKQFSCGENGDAFLNPLALDCLRIIRRKLPGCAISMFTNFQNLGENLSEPILRENLVDHFFCNMDGYDSDHYRAVKQADLRPAEENLRLFLDIRRRLGVRTPLQVMAINYNDYVDAIRRHFGVWPIKVAGRLKDGLKRDFRLISNKWRPLLDPETDRLVRVRGYMGWAERAAYAGQTIPYEQYDCPALDRVKHEVFIAPDGTWYACCLDAQCELVLGNVMDSPIETLATGGPRTRLIAMLERREFDRIGGPCRTVPCCRVVGLESFWDRLDDRLRNSWVGKTIRDGCARSRFLRHTVDRIRGALP